MINAATPKHFISLMGRQFRMAGFARFCTMERLGRNGFQ
jgi:hypothetical protein